MKKSRTFGEGREIILDAMVSLKNGTMKHEDAIAMAALFQSVNASINAEIKVAKMSIEASKLGKDFGDVMRLGTRPMFEGELAEE